MTQVKTRLTAKQWMVIGAICARDNMTLDEYAERAVAEKAEADNKELEKHRAYFGKQLQEA